MTELETEKAHPVTGLRGLRERIARRRGLNLAYRIGVAVVGVAVLALGVLAIPYPGPGWLIVFAGLGILASEFAWAHRVLTWVRDKYKQVMAWYTSQGIFVRALGAIATFLLVVVTLWLLNTFGWIGSWFGIDWRWISSPFRW
ncbi:TIGR02611 family protein [Nocardia callitridis]|uniref:TIGR02611 family protein n=1 Tax=Nocardia callitridis TaxID=648753 RepID=A0ABP9KC84_9NOCA